MTTPIVPSISDEQLAELESLADNVKCWNMPEAFQEAEEGVHPDEWEWHVGAIDEDGNQYPLLHVNAHQYDSDDSEILARYYAACNRAAIQSLIARLRAAEDDVERRGKALSDILTEVDLNIRPTVRDIINGMPDANDIYDYCDTIDRIAMAVWEPKP